MDRNFGRILLGMLLVAVSAFGAFGFAARSASAQMSDAKLRVVHGSPDAPAVDIYVNGSKAISNLAFKDVSSWATLPAGSYDVKVTPAGGTAGVIEAKLSLEGGKYYTVVAVGALANIKAQVVTSNFSAIQAGSARLQVVHASPDAPAVDVAVKGGPVLVPSLAFPDASGTLDVAAGSYDVEVRAAGTNTVAFSAPGLALQEGKLYTVFALGLLSGEPAFGLVPVADDLTVAPAAGMPATGAGDGLWLPALALILAASMTIGAGVVVRVRAR